MEHRNRSSLARGNAPALALLAVLALPLTSTPAIAQEAAAEPAMTADELIEKNLDAKGGREKIESVDAARITGTMTMQGPNGDMNAPFTLEWKAPDRTRMEFTIQGMTMVQAFDGETGWMINPFMGKTVPEKMSDEDAEMFREQGEFHGPLLDYEERGYTVEYAGEEDVEGTPTYKLVVTKPTGEVTNLFLDQDHFVEIRAEGTRTVRGQEVQSTISVGDYKEVDGLVMAHSLDITGAGGPGRINMTYESVELNPELSEERFTMPAVEEAEEDGSEGSQR